MAVEAATAVEQLRAALRHAGDADRALKAKAYVKSDLEFFGVAAKALRSAVQAFLEDHPEIGTREMIQLVSALGADPVFEMRGAAVAILERRQRELGPDDLGLIEFMLRNSHTWALVDWISTKVVAPVVSRHPEAKRVLRKWSRDRDFWLRRASMLSLLPDLRSGGGDFELFASLAVPMLSDTEFFIRKAIGWVLRDTGRKRPELVGDFVREHRHLMSPLTYREATRKLPATLRESFVDSRCAVPGPKRPVRRS